MTNRSKQKGTAAETAVVRYLKAQGFPAERRALSGNLDRGDIAGVPDTVIEVKSCARLSLSQWLAELDAEIRNDRARFGGVWHKRRGTTDPGEWYVTMPGHMFVALLKEAT